MKAYKRKDRGFTPHYPDDFEKIKAFLEENGTINVTDEKLQALFYTFSNKYSYLDENHSAWLPVTDEILDIFATYLENEDVSGKDIKHFACLF